MTSGPEYVTFGACACTGLRPGSSSKTIKLSNGKKLLVGRVPKNCGGACIRLFCILKLLETEKMTGDGCSNQAKNQFVPSEYSCFCYIS